MRDERMVVVSGPLPGKIFVLKGSLTLGQVPVEWPSRSPRRIDRTRLTGLLSLASNQRQHASREATEL